MVSGAEIPTEIWLLIASFIPKCAHNPIAFTRFSQICRSANAAFRSDRIWKHVNPYGLERDIHRHFTNVVTSLNPKQRRDLFFVWSFAWTLLDQQQYKRFDDTPIYRVLLNLIPSLKANENDYYNLGLLLSTVPIRDTPEPLDTHIEVRNRTVIKNAIAMCPWVYCILPKELQRDHDLVVHTLCTDIDILIHDCIPEDVHLSTREKVAIIESSNFKVDSGIFIEELDYREVARALIRHVGGHDYPAEIVEDIIKDEDLILEIITFPSMIYEKAPKDLRNDPEFTRKAVLACPWVVDKTMSLDLWRLAVWAHPKQNLIGAPPEYLPELMPKSLERAQDPREWFEVHWDLEGVKGLVKYGIELYCGLGNFWPRLVSSNRDKMLYSLKGADNVKKSFHYLSLVYLPMEFCDDREVVKAAVSVEGSILERTGCNFCDDKELVLKALESSKGQVFRSASSRLRPDREVVEKALVCGGTSLEYQDSEVKSSREFVKIAISNDGNALDHASEQLQADQDLKLLAQYNLFRIHEKQEDVPILEFTEAE